MTMDVLTAFYVTVGLMVFSGACGYYMGERGMSGVQIDLTNIKNDIAHIQGKLSGSPQTPIVTPVTDSSTPATPTAIVTPSK